MPTSRRPPLTRVATFSYPPPCQIRVVSTVLLILPVSDIRAPSRSCSLSSVRQPQCCRSWAAPPPPTGRTSYSGAEAAEAETGGPGEVQATKIPMIALATTPPQTNLRAPLQQSSAAFRSGLQLRGHRHSMLIPFHPVHPPPALPPHRQSNHHKIADQYTSSSFLSTYFALLPLKNCTGFGKARSIEPRLRPRQSRGNRYGN